MKKLTSILFLLLPFISFSQINFEEGYYIRNNNQKTDCLIRNLDWQNNPTFIEYKESVNSGLAKIGISDITEFSIGTDYKYKRFSVDIDRSSDNTETLFLKVLIEGEISLYSYQDENLIRYFIESDGQIQQLVYKPYLDAKNSLAQNKQYKQQLTMKLKSDNLTVKDFENLEYKKRSLVNLFEKYYGITTKNYSNLTKGQHKGNFNLKAVLGVNFSSAAFKNQIIKNSTLDLGSHTTPNIGIEAEYVLPFNKNKWSIFLNPNYQQYKGNYEKQYNRYVEKGEVDYTFISVPIGVRHYMYINNNSKIFLNMGYAISFNQKEHVFYENSYQVELELSNSPNFFFGAGFAYKKFSLEARYNTTRDLLREFFFFSSEFKTTSITASYNFL